MKEVSDNKERVTTPFDVTNAEEVRKAFIASEIFQRKY